jgi:hypothetical protein
MHSVAASRLMGPERTGVATFGAEMPRASRMGDNREPEEGHVGFNAELGGWGAAGWAVCPTPTTNLSASTDHR